MKKSGEPVRLSRAQARALMLRAQCLPPVGRPTLARVLERIAFVRTLGGVDAYLALRARIPTLKKAALDRAVDRQEARIVPSVRGCIYLVPESEVGPSMRAADLLSRDRFERDAQKAGIRPGEVETLARTVGALIESDGPFTTDALRRALPAGVVRSLGETGKKVGVSSPLPQALRLLEFAGRIERTTEGGRLDTERYAWRATKGAGTAPTGTTGSEDADATDLWKHFARIFFRAAGLATVGQLAAWIGIPKRDTAAAIEGLPLRPAEIQGESEAFLLWEEPRSAGEAAADAVAFLPFDDNLTALHDGPAILVDEAHHDLEVPQWGGKDTTLGASRHMAFRSFVADGKIAGFWEYDPDAKTVLTGWFAKPKPAARKAVAEGAASLAAFNAGELGHARSFSLDTDDELRERIGRMRQLDLH